MRRCTHAHTPLLRADVHCSPVGFHYTQQSSAHMAPGCARTCVTHPWQADSACMHTRISRDFRPHTLIPHDMRCVHTQMSTCTHAHTHSAWGAQGCSCAVRGDKQGPGAGTNIPQSPNHPRQPPLWGPCQVPSSRVLCSGWQGCLPGTSPASHPHPQLWLVDGEMNKK